MSFGFEHLTYSQYLLAALLTLLSVGVMGLFGKSSFQPKGKVCYVTGGSSGLGRALAKDLLKLGAAGVTVVARDVKRLQETEDELKSLAAPDQTVQSISCDLMQHQSSSDAFDAATSFHGRVPEYVFNCAGFSFPRFFIDATPEQLQEGLDGTYWVQAWTAHAAIKKMVANRIKGKLVFVGSFLGYTSFVGYTPYSPGKFALRGLTDALRSEMILHDISVHLYMSGGIDSPGHVNEQVAKPRITNKIEEGDTIISPEQSSALLIRGLKKDQHHISTMFVTDLVRMTAKGVVPGNNVFTDFAYWIMGGFGAPIWRMITDYQIRQERPLVHAELEQRGFYEVTPGGAPK